MHLACIDIKLRVWYFKACFGFVTPHIVCYYRKISNISRTKRQNLNDYRFTMQLSLHSPLKLGIKLRMKM